MVRQIIAANVASTLFLGFPLSSGGDSIIFAWSGAITESSAIVSVRARGNFMLGLSVRCFDCDTSSQVANISSFKIDGISTEKFLLTQLQPNRTFFFQPSIDGKEVSMTGSLRTLEAKAGDAANFSFLVSSCAQSGSQHPVYDTMRNERAHFLLHLGDLHYQNIQTNDPSLFAAGRVHCRANQLRSRTARALKPSSPEPVSLPTR